MESDIFKVWYFVYFVSGVTKYLISCNIPTKVVFLIDNALIHPKESELPKGNITIKFLPLNVIVLVQPIYQGVLQNIKKVYKLQMQNEPLENDEEQSCRESQINQYQESNLYYC